MNDNSTQNTREKLNAVFNRKHCIKQWLIREGGGWVPVPPPPPLCSFFFFYKNEVYKPKISIKRVRNLSQIAGNGHFRDSNFRIFLGEHALRSPRKLSLVMPPPKVLAPPLKYVHRYDKISINLIVNKLTRVMT